MGNSFGKLLQIMTFGESHGPGVGVVIDGIPGNMPINLDDVQQELFRRRPGQSKLTSPRQEADRLICLSGIEDGRSLGGPITIYVENGDKRSNDYKDIQQVFRPGHADFTMLKKYGITAKSGGGRASARETVGRVAAGAIALQVIRQIIPDLDIVAWVQSVKDVCATSIPESSVSRQEVDQSDVRCPDPNAAQLMTELINKVKANGDSVGGVIRCVMRGVPPGLGEPVFDKLEADLAKAMMSLPATKGFEVGSGFKSTLMLGSEHNDPLQVQEGKICSTSNHAGGINGGISNGEIITINIAFKPVSTIFRPQQTVDRRGNNITFTPESGRHDPCVLPRAVPMVEAMAALVIADHVLRWRATGAFIKPSF